MENPQKHFKSKVIFSIIFLFVALSLISVIAAEKIFAEESNAAHAQVQNEGKASGAAGYAFVGAAIAFGLGAIGAGIGIGNVGAAAMGAIAEKPEMAGQALIFVALAEGLVIFGFITALMILGKV